MGLPHPGQPSGTGGGRRGYRPSREAMVPTGEQDGCACCLEGCLVCRGRRAWSRGKGETEETPAGGPASLPSWASSAPSPDLCLPETFNFSQPRSYRRKGDGEGWGRKGTSSRLAR